MHQNNREKFKHAADKTLKTMIPAVGTAILATMLGFIALFISPVPMIQDFGKMLTIGVVISFFAGIFLLIPILYTRDRYFAIHQAGKQTNANPKLENALRKLASRVISARWFIIPIAFTLTGLGIWADLQVDVETDIETFMPQDTEELQDIHKVRDILGTTDQVAIVYETESLWSEESIQWVDEITKSLKQEFPEEIVSSQSLTTLLRQINDGELPEHENMMEVAHELPVNQRKMFVNEDETRGTILLGIKHLEAGDLKPFIADLNNYLDDQQLMGIRTTVTGKSVLDTEMVSALTSGRHEMTLLGMALVFAGLFIIYRHPVKAFVPLLPISLIVGWSGAAMYLLNLKYTPLSATLGALIIGIGTEFTILLMERFYEERKKGKDSKLAMITAVQKIGKAIIASGLTVIGGFSALLISDFPILRDFGLMTLINMSLALLSTLVVMPGIMILLDRFVKTKQTEHI